MASTTPYGYLKDKDDPNVWIVDEEAAVVVRRIFHMTMDGYGPYQIARSFRTAIARGAARTAPSSSTISMMSAGIWT